MAFWLMKSEPVTYGIHHLKAEGETLWDGVRNYQARNFLQTMAVGDQAFFLPFQLQATGHCRANDHYCRASGGPHAV